MTQALMPSPPVTPVLRFAPSPNGFLHLGHAFAALTGFAVARALGGRFLLRIEDVDTTRSRENFVDAILEDLEWLGITFETPVMRQSTRFGLYAAHLARLREMGLVYPAFETRAEIARLAAVRETQAPCPRDPDGAPLYPGARLSAEEESRRLDAGLPFALRLDMRAALARTRPLGFREAPIESPADIAAPLWAERRCAPEAWGDVVLGRKEVPASYHLAVVIDDAAQGVTHVVRGTDLLAATDIHRVLQTLFGLPAPLYRHHTLVRGPDGRKLSKSEAATALRTLRADGVSAADIRRRLGFG
jgi:glutamyl-Q tRNA(Asp) synthetase